MNAFLKRLVLEIAAPQAVLKEKFEAFKELLEADRQAHRHMARLEEIYHRQLAVDLTQINHNYQLLAESVGRIVEALSRLKPVKYAALQNYFKKFDSYTRYFLDTPALPNGPPYAGALTEIDSKKMALWGGKAVNLADMVAMGLPVPPGFVVSTGAMGALFEANALQAEIDRRLNELDIEDTRSVQRVSQRLMELIRQAKIPTEVKNQVETQLGVLENRLGSNLLLAVRSSAVGEDSNVSFAGQYSSILNVKPQNAWEAYLEIVASRYSPEALVYRIKQGYADSETPMAAIVMAMVDAQKAGVVYGAGVSGEDSEQMSIYAVAGLGEKLVDGSASAEKVSLNRAQLEQSGTAGVDFSSGSLLDEATCRQLARWALQLQARFGSPQDIEWASDQSGRLFLLQTRPLQNSVNQGLERRQCEFEDVPNSILLEGGIAASLGITAGPVFRMLPGRSLAEVPLGSILVVSNASPRYVTYIHRVKAIVAEQGSQAGHLASVAREFGIPLVVQARGATSILTDGKIVTVNADEGKVFDGKVDTMLESSCAQWNYQSDNPFMRRLAFILEFISPLSLNDPGSADFQPEGCRSMHDIIRFAHEKAVDEIFSQHQRRIFKIQGSKTLRTGIPLQILVVDLGGGLAATASGKKIISLDDVKSKPLLALFKGLSHPGIKWKYGVHFDWSSHDKIVMGGGIVSADAAMFASHAMVARNYTKLNFTFGYHFVVVDAMRSREEGKNHVLFRFAGGGAEMEKRMLRAQFLEQVLLKFGFEVKRTGDMVDAQANDMSAEKQDKALDFLGRLLGATRLMDMYLKNKSDLPGLVDDFLKGRYDFSSSN